MHINIHTHAHTHRLTYTRKYTQISTHIRVSTHTFLSIEQYGIYLRIIVYKHTKDKRPHPRQHTTTTHCNNTLQQHTATTHCINTLKQHAATTTHSATPRTGDLIPAKTIQQHTATTHCNNTLQQHTTTITHSATPNARSNQSFMFPYRLLHFKEVIYLSFSTNI